MRHAILRVTDADLTLGGQSRTPADLEDRGATTARVQIPGVPGGLGIVVTHLDHKAESCASARSPRRLRTARPPLATTRTF